MKKIIRKIKVTVWELNRRHQIKKTVITDDTIRGIAHNYWRGVDRPGRGDP